VSITIKKRVKGNGKVRHDVFVEDVRIGSFYSKRNAKTFVESELEHYLYQARVEAAREVEL
jgi:hypothetical protein